MIDRTLISGNSASPVILHVPHSSRVVPDEIRRALLVTDAQLAHELDEITDAHTDTIAARAADVADSRPWTLRNDLSRLVVDPERFPDEREELAAVGRGAVYTRTASGSPLREDNDHAARKTLMDRYFHPYAADFDAAVAARIEATGHAVIVDVHSYPTLPSRYELHADGPRPALCIGTDPHHTPAWLCEAAYAAFADLRDITTDSPFTGTYVPLSRYNTDHRVSSVMIELRRDQYTDNPGAPDIDSIEHIAAMLARLVDAADRASG
jgi:N-formylglutamate deformylase